MSWQHPNNIATAVSHAFLSLICLSPVQNPSPFCKSLELEAWTGHPRLRPPPVGRPPLFSTSHWTVLLATLGGRLLQVVPPPAPTVADIKLCRLLSPSTASAQLQQPHGEGAEGVGDQKPFKGIRMRRWGRWVSEIRIPRSRTRIWLGSYDTPEKAARAYDAALYCLHGGRGRVNFPDAERPKFPEELRLALSKSDIKAIAARFASSPPGCGQLQLPSSSPAGSSQLTCESRSAGAAASKCDGMSDPLVEEDCGSPFGFDDFLLGDPVLSETYSIWDLL